jgi:hypothetical protein
MLIAYLAKKLTFARAGPVRENDRFFIPAVAVKCAPAHMARTSWLIVTFDTDGEVSFGGTLTLINLVFKSAPNINCACFRLRHQYHIW